MDLKELTAKGGFVASEPVKKEVEWVKTVDGQEETIKFDVFVKRHSFGVIEKFFSGGEDKSKAAAYIAESILMGEKANQRMTYDQAFQLDPTLASCFIKVINEVNGTGKTEPKN